MRLFVRAGAGSGVGLGHLSRTSALVEAAADLQIPATYVVRDDPIAASFLARRGLDAIGLEPGWLDRIRPGDIVVHDDYATTRADVEAAREAGARTVALDDHGAPSLPADVVVHPNGPVDASALPATTLVLHGPAHALVRRAFRERRRLRAGGAGRLLVSFGGSDPTAAGPAVVTSLGTTPRFDTVVLLEGPGSAPIGHRRPWLEVHRDPPEPADVFDAVDAGVTAAGSSCWELLAMGLPIAVRAVVDNQAIVARTAVGAGAAIELDAAPLDAVVARLADAAEQRSLSEAALDLVDGLGPRRILDAVR